MSRPWADRNVAWVDYDAAWQPRTARAPLGRAGGALAVRAAASAAATGAGVGRAGVAFWTGSVWAVIAATVLIRPLAGLFVLNPCGIDQPVRKAVRLASPVAVRARLAASVTTRARTASPVAMSARLVSAVKLQQP